MAKLKKKEIREDRIGEAVGAAWNYARSHVEIVGGSALVLVILVLAAVLFFQNQAKSEAEAILVFDSAQATYLRAANPQDMQDVISQFENLSQRYGNVSSGRKALLYLGLSYRRLGDNDKAIPYLRRFLSKGDRNDILRAAGEEVLAACYEDKGDFKGAAKLYETMAGHFAKDPLVASRALISAGRCYEAARDPGSARRMYQDLLERYPMSPRGIDARTALAMLPPAE